LNLTKAAGASSGSTRRRSVIRRPATGGNAGRNTASLPGLVSVDLSVFKNFAFTECHKLQFRTEFFNLPNYANFRGLSRAFDASNPGELSSALPGLQIQFALKLIF
jgi:hypothetical protein